MEQTQTSAVGDFFGSLLGVADGVFDRIIDLEIAELDTKLAVAQAQDTTASNVATSPAQVQAQPFSNTAILVGGGIVALVAVGLLIAALK